MNVNMEGVTIKKKITSKEARLCHMGTFNHKLSPQCFRQAPPSGSTVCFFGLHTPTRADLVPCLSLMGYTVPTCPSLVLAALPLLCHKPGGSRRVSACAPHLNHPSCSLLTSPQTSRICVAPSLSVSLPGSPTTTLASLLPRPLQGLFKLPHSFPPSLPGSEDKGQRHPPLGAKPPGAQEMPPLLCDPPQPRLRAQTSPAVSSKEHNAGPETKRCCTANAH